LLAAPPADHLALLPDAGLLVVSLARNEGLVVAEQEELRAGCLPSCWDLGLASSLASLWSNLPWVEGWNPQDGWCTPAAANPYPSAYLLLLLLLARLPQDSWANPTELEQWLLDHHPYWTGGAQSAERETGSVERSVPGTPRSALRAPRPSG